MKILGRMLIILVAALVVVGVTFALGHSSFATSLNTAPPRGQFAPRPPDGPVGQGFPVGRRPGGVGAPWYFGLMEVGQNFVIIGAIVAAGTQGLRLARRRPTPAGQRRQSPPNPT